MSDAQTRTSSTERPLNDILRMPLGFGPGVGPRQNPYGPPFDTSTLETLTLSVTAYTDQALLQNLLPEGVIAAGNTLSVDVARLRNISWLAGRGYNIVSVRTPVVRENHGPEQDTVDYMNVLWENRADPIITGREELGFAKVYAEISDLTEPVDGAVSAVASWDEFDFLTVASPNLEPCLASELSAPRARLHYKYIPATGRWGTSDAAYLVVTPATNPTVSIDKVWSGDGSFHFNTATFEQLPTLMHIVNALADVPVHEFGRATLVSTRGGKSLIDQHPDQ